MKKSENRVLLKLKKYYECNFSKNIRYNKLVLAQIID